MKCNFKSTRDLPNENFLSHVLITFVIFITCALVSCKSEDSEEVQQQEVVQTAPIEIPLPADEVSKYHDAIRRISDFIDQTCFDSETKTWFVHSAAKHYHWSGWYYENHNNIEVLEFGNNTLAVAHIEDTFNDSIKPNVVGMDCKLYTPDLSNDEEEEDTSHEQSSSEETT